MPRLDKTGPRGLGPRTGRGLGQCNHENASTSESRPLGAFGPGQGLGFRRGAGLRGQRLQGLRNRCRRWWNQLTHA